MPTDDLPQGAREIAAAGALAKRARSGPTALITLTDEEMLAIYGDHADGQFASPWLDRVAEDRGERFDKGLLVATTRRAMLARGMIAPEIIMAQAEKREPLADPHKVMLNLLIAGIVTRRNQAAIKVEASASEPEQRGTHCVFVDRDNTVLYEQVSPDGLHHFVMQQVPDSVSMLRAFLMGRPASENEMSDSEDGPVSEAEIFWRGPADGAASDSDLLEHTGQLLSAATITASGDNSLLDGETLMISGHQGLSILEPDPDDPDSDLVVARAMSVSQLDSVLGHLLYGDNRGGSANE